MSTPLSKNELKYLIKRYWFLIFSTTILITLLAIYWMENTFPVFEASCKLLIVDTDQGGALLDQKDMVLGELGKSDPIITQVEVMKTLPIFKETIKRCNLKNNDSEPLDPEEFAKQIFIEPIKKSNIVLVSYRSYDPYSAVIVANTFVKVAEEYNKNLNREELRNMRLFIEKQLESQKVRLKEIEQASVKYKKKEKTIDIGLQTKSQIDAARDIELEIMKLQSEREGILAQKRQLESDLDVPRAQTDPFYKSQRLNMIEQIDTKLSSIGAQKALLRRQLQYINKKLSSKPQEEVNITRFLRDEKIADETYSNLLSKLQELELKEAASPASLKLIEEATIPEAPVFPQKKKTIVLALIFGFFLGCGIAFLQAFIEDVPYSVNTIKSVLPYDILGTVPRAKKNKEIFFNSPSSTLFMENIRHIHTNLSFREIYQSNHLNLMVTSAAYGEGKRITCTNLVFSIAETGRSTVLVNLDLQRSVFKDIFNITNKCGVADFLNGNAEFSDIIYHHSENGFKFDIIDAGVNGTSPTHKYLLGKHDEFFNLLERKYQVCLFYSAPILTSPDTLDLSRYMNGIILVTDWIASRMKSVHALQEILTSKKLPVLGTIINRAKAVV